MVHTNPDNSGTQKAGGVAMVQGMMTLEATTFWVVEYLLKMNF